MTVKSFPNFSISPIRTTSTSGLQTAGDTDGPTSAVSGQPASKGPALSTDSFKSLSSGSAFGTSSFQFSNITKQLNITKQFSNNSNITKSNDSNIFKLKKSPGTGDDQNDLNNTR